MPKNISSFSKHEIIIVFFNQIPNTSFIGFRVKVSKDTLTQESNSLLLFLKRCKEASFCPANNYIHVQCGTNAWELFYCLYADYLKKYVLTFIGTQFFTQFVYSHCIQKEIQLIDMLYKGSKVIKVSKKSIYYEIHRKRKISVTDLIHMTLNMPSRKKFIISCFSSKEPLLHSHMNDGNFYTPIGTKINVSKLMLKQLKKHSENILCDSADKSVNFQMIASSNSAFSVPSRFTSSKPISSSSTTMKKKFCELDFDKDIKPGPSTSKFIRSSVQTSTIEDQWEQYQNLKPYTVKAYSSIPCLSNLVPNLLKNGKSSHFVHETSYLFNNDYNISLLPSTSSSNKEETSEVTDLIHSSSLTLNGSESKIAQVKNEADHVVKQSNNVETLNTSQNNGFSELQNDENPEFHRCQKISGHSSDASTISSRTYKSINERGCSSVKMQAARKLIQVLNDENQQNLKEVDNCDPNKVSKTTSFKKNYPNYRRKLTTDSITLAKIPENKPSPDIKNDQGTSKCFDSLEDVFSTAAGKSIAISNAALEVAYKLVEDDYAKETIPTSSKNICFDAPKNKMYKHESAIFKDIDCSSKAIDENISDIDMDKTLVQKFFEDSVFDEEFESSSKCKKDDNLDLLSKSDKNIPSQKPRKSLGGRRIMRYSSNKL